MKDPHCVIGTIIVKAERRPPGCRFSKTYLARDGQYQRRIWEMENGLYAPDPEAPSGYRLTHFRYVVVQR